MCIKNALILFFVFLGFNTFSQIEIDDVGDGWKQKVDSALVLIKTVDKENWDVVRKYCHKVSYWIGDFSTTDLPHTVLITTNDIGASSINNIACIIVHESYHLKLWNDKEKMTLNEEEAFCYEKELDFAKKVPNIEVWLVLHIVQNMIRYKELHLHD